MRAMTPDAFMRSLTEQAIRKLIEQQDGIIRNWLEQQTGGLGMEFTMFPEAADLVSAHNKLRVAEGMMPLRLDACLTTAAQEHADWMQQTGQLTHYRGTIIAKTIVDRVKESGYAPISVGENIAAGQTSVPQVMYSWRSSPGHYANILGDFTQVGVGRSGDFWCVIFGKPDERVEQHPSASQACSHPGPGGTSGD